MIYKKLGNKTQIQIGGKLIRCNVCSATQFKSIKIFRWLMCICNNCGNVCGGKMTSNLEEENG